jgi:hypothetical protein
MSTTKTKSPVANKKGSKQLKADLRVCASCEWIYRLSDPLPKEKLEKGFEQGQCPQCRFASYGARYVFGNKTYRYAITQEPWKRRKLTDFEYQLDCQIQKENPIKEKPKPKNPFRYWQNMGQEYPSHV